MEFTILTLIFSLLGFGVQTGGFTALECGDVSPLSQSADMSAHSKKYELNDVPNNITLQIDGYEIAYPIKTEILGADGLSMGASQRAPTYSQPSTDLPRYYILAEPILYRRAGDSEWESLYEPEPLCPDYDFVVLKCKPPKETEK